VGEKRLHLQIDAVGPSEADDVAFVSGGDGDVGGAADYIVFFADGGIG
jgi:precorrin-3B methylase